MTTLPPDPDVCAVLSCELRDHPVDECKARRCCHLWRRQIVMRIAREAVQKELDRREKMEREA